MAEAVLRAHRLAKFYGPRLVFKNVSCEIERARITLVVGGNGAGKSTLLRLMAGLAAPSAGKVDLALAPEKVAYLGHPTFLYPRLSARDNLRFWGRMYGLSPSKADLDAVLERVGLLRFAEERSGGFSRGMAQRLNLARVFLVEPELVFLDEPGTGLDQASLTRLRQEIEGFRDRGAAVVWVSHQVREDTALADCVVHLDQGKARYVGPAAEFVPEGPVC